MEITAYLNDRRQLVEQYLASRMLTATGDFSEHIDSMRYSLFVGGKRIRPILCLAAADAISGENSARAAALPVAAALECIHTYSLIHDDLPAMDNDDLRRGKPTNHTVFGEAAAILAGDGLLTFAFELLSAPQPAGARPSDAVRIRVIQTIARAAGPLGMVGGQSLDMLHEGDQVGYETLRTIHRSKTGALITASVLSGAIIAEATPAQEALFRTYGEHIGLAFQIADDILDVESTTEQLGKRTGGDIEAHKVTYPSLFGMKTSHLMAQEAAEAAIRALEDFDHKADPLRTLASFIVQRTH